MTNAQRWLESKFPGNSVWYKDAYNQPLRINRQDLTELQIEAGRVRWVTLQNQGAEEIREAIDLVGELDINEYVNLWMFYVKDQPNLTLTKAEKLTKLVVYRAERCSRLSPIFGFLEGWKREIEQLKVQLAEYEREESSSQTSTESSYSDLEGKIREKEAQLNSERNTTRRSTAPLRKEIELLKKLLGMENRVKELEAHEQEYQRQLQEKERAIQQLQTQLNNWLSDSPQRRIAQLEQQLQSLESEKSALQERIVQEREEALKEWEEEKTNLQTNLAQLKDQKDTFQRSASYLRETLKTTEKGLEEVKAELVQEKTKTQELEKEKATLKESHQSELKNRGEAYSVIQERNKELEKKLSGAQGEIGKLGEWIGKLEGLSGDGKAWERLRKELEGARGQVMVLREELSAKKGRSYWWFWVLVVLIVLYFIMR